MTFYTRNPGQTVHERALKYSQETGIGYRTALTHVLHNDPQLASDYHSCRPVAENESYEVDRVARQYQKEHGGSYLDALRAVCREAEEKTAERASEVERRVAAYQDHFEIKTYDAAKEKVFEHDPKLFVESGSSGMQELASVILGVPRLTDGSINIETAIQAASGFSELIQQAAGEHLVGLMRTWIRNHGLPGQESEHFASAMKQVRNDHPAVARAWADGSLSEEALREMFGQFFK